MNTRQQIMENIGLWAANNAINLIYWKNNQRSRQAKLIKVYMKTSKRAREARKNLPKTPQGKKDRKSGTGQAQLTSPARTTSLIDCKYQKATKNRYNR